MSSKLSEAMVYRVDNWSALAMSQMVGELRKCLIFAQIARRILISDNHGLYWEKKMALHEALCHALSVGIIILCTVWKPTLSILRLCMLN